jgi:hypothetical protein
MEITESLNKIHLEILAIKKFIQERDINNSIYEKWVSERQLKKFLGYGSTQMALFLKAEGLMISKIGKRKFILRDSLDRLLQKRIL